MLHNITGLICKAGSNDEQQATAEWIVKSFPIIKIVLVCVLAVLAIGMIIFVLLQKSNSNGVSAISGQTDTFYNKNKGATLQGKIKVLTIIDAVCILVVCVAYLVLNTIFQGFI